MKICFTTCLTQINYKYSINYFLAFIFVVNKNLIYMTKQNLVIFERRGVRYLLRDEEFHRDTFPQPDFMHTKKALVGILKENETIDQFVKRINARDKDRFIAATKALSKKKK